MDTDEYRTLRITALRQQTEWYRIICNVRLMAPALMSRAGAMAHALGTGCDALRPPKARRGHTPVAVVSGKADGVVVTGRGRPSRASVYNGSAGR